MKKKVKKSRAVAAGYKLYASLSGTFVLPIPYDKKDRVIPSSVECAYNAEYFSLPQILAMVQAL